MINKINKSFPLILIGGLVIGAASFVAPVALADQVSARGSDRNGVARIVFTWPSSVPFVARVKNRQLVVQFSRPAEGDFTALARSLNKYIGAPRSRDGGRTLIFPLRKNFDINYYSRGRTVVVEVIDPTALGKSASPKPTASSAPYPIALERVKVRTGEHDSYGRIVFDWRKPVKYKVTKQGNLAIVTFQRPANIVVAPLNRNSVANVRGANAQISNTSTTIALSVSSTSRIKHFRKGLKVVVDVFNPTGLYDAQPISELVPKASAFQQVAKNTPRTKAPKGDNVKKNSPRVLKPSKLVAVPKPPDESAPGPVKAGNVKTVSLRVDWGVPVAAAVFRRAGNLWLIFNKPVKIDVAKLKAQGGNVLRLIEQVPSNRATILRVLTVGGVNPSLRRDGLAWIFDFKKQPLRPQTPIKVKSLTASEAGPSLVALISGSREGIPLRDPEVGDNLV
ncbi:MAG: hypothetical protein ACKVIK_08050, partial [Rhodospirillales bacterium]